MLLLGVAFAYLAHPDSKEAKDKEHDFALAAFIVASVMFVAYSVYQVRNESLQQKEIAHAQDEARREVIFGKWGDVIMGALLQNKKVAQVVTEHTALLDAEGGGPRAAAPKKEVDVKKFFGKWRVNVAEKKEAAAAAAEEEKKKGEDQEEEEEDKYGHLTKKQVVMRSALLLTVGVGLVTAFSDPMVDVITDLGKKMKISPFYLSFVVTPFCSNASELISSIIFASRKTQTNSTITFSQLLGAACMNNTLGVGVLCGLIYFRGLAWTFSAEVLSIVVTIFVTGLLALRSTQRLWVAVVNSAMYFVSLALVVFMEGVFGWT